jgi:hypothetical protein
VSRPRRSSGVRETAKNPMTEDVRLATLSGVDHPAA